MKKRKRQKIRIGLGLQLMCFAYLTTINFTRNYLRLGEKKMCSFCIIGTFSHSNVINRITTKTRKFGAKKILNKNPGVKGLKI